MESLLSILLIILTVELLVIAACFVIVTYFLAKSLNSFTNFVNSINRMKPFLAIPALLVALVSKLFKRR